MGVALQGGSANGSWLNCICTQLDRLTANQRNETRDEGSATTSRASTKVRPTRDTRLRLARVALDLLPTSVNGFRPMWGGHTREVNNGSGCGRLHILGHRQINLGTGIGVLKDQNPSFSLWLFSLRWFLLKNKFLYGVYIQYSVALKEAFWLKKKKDCSFFINLTRKEGTHKTIKSN